jgi:Dockerin type I domain
MTLLLILSMFTSAVCQNGILIVASQPELMGDISKLDSMFQNLWFNPTYTDQLPERIDPHLYSLVIIAEYKEGGCYVLPEFLREGGCVILTGGIPSDLFSNCEIGDAVNTWLGFSLFQNFSGEAVATTNLNQINLPRDSLLDRTACDIGFGGLNGKNEGAEILAEWICPGDSRRVAAITFNSFEKGKVFYFSRLLSAVRVRELLTWALDTGIEYRWGDADNSGGINITDAVFIVKLVFTGGDLPTVLNAGDCNADGSINVSDAVYLLNYIFTDGPSPQAGWVE